MCPVALHPPGHPGAPDPEDPRGSVSEVLGAQCCWHLVDGGQGCFCTSCSAPDGPTWGYPATVCSAPAEKTLPCDMNSDLCSENRCASDGVPTADIWDAWEYLRDSLDRESQRPWYAHMIFMARPHVGFEHRGRCVQTQDRACSAR